MFSTHKLLFRIVCWTLAVITPLSPSVVVLAQTTADAEVAQTPLRIEYLAPNPAAIVALRPRQLLSCEATKMMPVEVVSAACLKELGFDPANVTSVLLSATPPLAGPPNYAAVLELTERIDLATLAPQLTRDTAPGTRNGQAYLQSQHPALPSLYWADDTTLLVAPEQTLEQLLAGNQRELDPFAKELAAGSSDDLRLLVNVALLRPLIQLGLSQAATEMPSALQGLLELPDHIRQVRVRFSISGAGPVELSCEANDAAAANRIEELNSEMVGFYLESATQQASKLLASEDPVEQAMGRYLQHDCIGTGKRRVDRRLDQAGGLEDGSQEQAAGFGPHTPSGYFSGGLCRWTRAEHSRRHRPGCFGAPAHDWWW